MTRRANLHGQPKRNKVCHDEKDFAILASRANLSRMTEPLAILFYEKSMPGSQLANRLQDLGYRVQVLTDADALPSQVEQAKPMIVIADLFSGRQQVRQALAGLRQNPATAHVPVIAFSTHTDSEAQPAAPEPGPTMFVTEAAIIHHLPQLLERALTEF